MRNSSGAFSTIGFQAVALRNSRGARCVRVKRSAFLSLMTPTTAPSLGQIHALLAEKGYEVLETGPETLKIRDIASGVTVQSVLQGEILYFSLPCTVVPRAAVTAGVMAKMLDSQNGISTSYFQLYEAGSGQVAITLNNFCKLQEMGPDDDDDILSCVHFLFVDVMAARHLLAGLS
jgi:hypothetical protein